MSSTNATADKCRPPQMLYHRVVGGFMNTYLCAFVTDMT